MKSLVFGSLNLDKTFAVDHIVAPGETLAALNMTVFTGGKGFNQAVALARSGSEVYFAGAVGEDGGLLLDTMEKEGIHTEHVQRLPGQTGQALIQVDRQGQNCILLLAGANGQITESFADHVLKDFSAGDMILLQNEISSLRHIVETAHAKGMRVVLNPSPYHATLAKLIPCVDIALLNEVEGEQLTGEKEPERILDVLHSTYPALDAVLTLGGNGAWFMQKTGERFFTPASPCEVVDTTAAGDTFTGYFLTQYLNGSDAAKALRIAARASAIAVSRRGAATSIPMRSEVCKDTED